MATKAKTALVTAKPVKRRAKDDNSDIPTLDRKELERQLLAFRKLAYAVDRQKGNGVCWDELLIGMVKLLPKYKNRALPRYCIARQGRMMTRSQFMGHCDDFSLDKCKEGKLINDCSINIIVGQPRMKYQRRKLFHV